MFYIIMYKVLPHNKFYIITLVVHIQYKQINIHLSLYDIYIIEWDDKSMEPSDNIKFYFVLRTKK